MNGVCGPSRHQGASQRSHQTFKHVLLGSDVQRTLGCWNFQQAAFGGPTVTTVCNHSRHSELALSSSSVPRKASEGAELNTHP
eukprot:m.235008 g.235008  ORF g.235008 m.235008 type:complete len:83 (-) comp15258_c4_seq1:3990-4238(-)